MFFNQLENYEGVLVGNNASSTVSTVSYQLFENKKQLFCKKFNQKQSKYNPVIGIFNDPEFKESLPVEALSFLKCSELNDSLIPSNKELEAFSSFIDDQNGWKYFSKTKSSYIKKHIQLGTENQYILRVQDGYEAFQNMVSKVEWIDLMFTSTIKKLIPLKSKIEMTENEENYGAMFTHNDCLGHIYTGGITNNTTPERYLEFFLGLVHEMAHTILYAYSHCDKIFEKSSEWPYSSIVRTRRPALLALHGMLAAMFMAIGARYLKSTEPNLDSYKTGYLDYCMQNYYRISVATLNSIIKTKPKLTSFGDLILQESSEVLMLLKGECNAC